MISFANALQTIMSQTYRLGAEAIPLHNASGRVLSQDVVSDMDMPPFNKSAVDGYACRMSDIANPLQLIETIAAGSLPQKSLSANQCSKIMTGAMLPQGADCVLMVEDTTLDEHNNIRFQKPSSYHNICFQAEDVKLGTQVLSAGTLIRPEHIAVLASVGCSQPFVAIKPKVGIISTGDELVEPFHTPSSAQIRNSNSWQLMAQALQMNVEATYYGIAQDTEESTLQKIAKALATNDIVLLTGGVSMGDFDVVPDMMLKAGLEIMFRSIAIQPGKPTVFATKDNKFCFGLPGNPVSSYVLFEILVKPLLYQLMGHLHAPLIFKIPFAHNYNRRRNDRLAFVPITFNPEGTISTINYHGSAHIHSITLAQGFAYIPIGTTSIQKGELVDVRPL